jgi:choline dehydrogenase-like flavoprotein
MADRATRWLSRSLVGLVEQGLPEFDVVIVGSGYGGAVAAAELAARARPGGVTPLRVCVLERGQEYLQGMFPSTMSELAGHVRFATPNAPMPRGRLGGLFDLRAGGDCNVLVANGLGGGSLINAGALAVPHASVWSEARWPSALRGVGIADQLVKELISELGGKPWHEASGKGDAIEALGARAAKPAITVAAHDGLNAAAVRLNACIGCGDCATGCNHNAKDSLDLNLLRRAQAAGAEIFTGATVMRIERRGEGWAVLATHTDDKLRRRKGEPLFEIRARAVVLAAGTLGSTEILMRSRDAGLAVSAQLGANFSANADLIAAAYALDRPVKGAADPARPPHERLVGPTITRMQDHRAGNPATDFVVQDLGIPSALRRLFEEVVTTGNVLERLGEADPRRHRREAAGPDDAAVNPREIERSLALAIIGRDSADGRLRVPEGRDSLADGVVGVTWPELVHDQRFDRHHEQVAKAVRGLGGRLLANPLWRPLAGELAWVFGERRGPLFTVHPLGGCAMADDAARGVVDHAGRVFDPAGNDGGGAPKVHPDLYVLDGAIVPTSLGINPALTIAALARRAIGQWVASRDWLAACPPRAGRLPGETERPRYADRSAALRATPTRVEFSERLSGEQEGYRVELTLAYEPKVLAELFAAGGAERRLDVAPGLGRLLVQRGRQTLLDAEVRGRMQLFRCEESWADQRRARALAAWAVNRGVRDIAQGAARALQSALAGQGPPRWREIARQACSIAAVATRAGAVRLIEYDLKVSAVSAGDKALVGAPLRGAKRLTYACRSNPWTQLQTLPLSAFPLPLPGGRMPVLEFDQEYAAAKGVALLRIVDQQDRPAALADLTSFALYALRLLLQLHALALREAEAPPPGPPRRLAGVVRGLPPPQVQWLEMPPRDGKPPARVRLVRYAAPAAAAKGMPPVLLVHGYSASSTTFAHDAVPDGLAPTLVRAGRDVWLIDLRTSAGLDTASVDWAFEDAALHDLPAAVSQVREATGSPTVDLVAHCMGAAMVCMAVLFKRAGDPRGELHRRVGRLVLSQAGPVLKMSAANLLRAYVMRYVRYFLPLQDYRFRIEPGEATFLDEVIDRVLATTPYPPGELALENPLWPPGKATPWVRARHRMDALYARTFSLANMSEKALDRIDDFFGALSTETVAQVIHFARLGTITDRKGWNWWVFAQRLAEQMGFPVLALHGQDNGLVDVRTLDLLGRAWLGAGLNWINEGAHVSGFDLGEPIARMRRTNGASLITWAVPDHGHQDCMIGRDAGRIAAAIAAFLDRGLADA